MMISTLQKDNVGCIIENSLERNKTWRYEIQGGDCCSDLVESKFSAKEADWRREIMSSPLSLFHIALTILICLPPFIKRMPEATPFQLKQYLTGNQIFIPLSK